MDGPCSSDLVSRLLLGLVLPQVGLGSLEVIPAVAGMAFPRPLLFGGPVGSRRGPTPLKENGGECSVCGLVPRTGYLLARDVTTRESARARILPPAASERRRRTFARRGDRQVQRQPTDYISDSD